MAFSLSVSSQRDRPSVSLCKEFLPLVPRWNHFTTTRNYVNIRNYKSLSVSAIRSSPKIVRDRPLDRQVEKNNKIRFVQKLKTLLLSKPKHYMSLQNLSKCRSYLSLPKPRSLRSMIHRYPSIFEVFAIPRPPTPLNAIKSTSQLCVRLTPAAEALASRESALKSTISVTLAVKLQKLLMLSSHRRLLLSKLVHLAPDLGMLPNFRSRLCNEHPDKFKTIDTSYGRALELVSWDPQLAVCFPVPDVDYGLIVDRPLKFKHLRLRKGLNVKRPHQEYLIKFGELPDVCPYNTPAEELVKESVEAEKRACAVVREVLGMMVEKRTLVDHLTHFRKEFGLPNKLRAMLIRHPELFYVSIKGQRDSVFLVESYDDKGALKERDEILSIKDQLMDLVWEAKRMRKERRTGSISYNVDNVANSDYKNVYDHGDDDYGDGLDDLFQSDDSDADDDLGVSDDDGDSDEDGDFPGTVKEFWTAEAAYYVNRDLEPW